MVVDLANRLGNWTGPSKVTTLVVMLVVWMVVLLVGLMGCKLEWHSAAQLVEW